MKKYKLKKDLPTWKAGEEFWIGEDECLYGLSKEGKPIMVYHAITLINFDLLKNGEWFEEIPETLKSVWELKEGDEYYYIDSDYNCMVSSTYENHYFHKSRIESGNAFLSEQEAEKELEKRKAIQKIKKYCWENNIDTKHNGDVYSSYAFNLNDSGEVVFFGDLQNGNPLGYFSHENAQKILDKFEEELKIILE